MTPPSPKQPARRLTTLLVMAAVSWHLLSVLSPPRPAPPPGTAGRDFASYHYAVKVALAGGDPYDRALLDGAARADGTRRSVHPYLYPPPFLLAVAWSAPLSLQTGFGVWFALNELGLLVAALALIRGWRPLSWVVTPLVAVVIALAYPVAYGAELGQANHIVLALVVSAGILGSRRPAAAGIALGIACMLKMAPALLVLWWMLKGRWRPVGFALAAAAAISVLSLSVVGIEHQVGFYTRVLPGLGAGAYNGLTIKLGMFGNHSIPNVMHQLFPSGSDYRLGGIARASSSALTLVMIGALAWRFRRPGPRPLQEAAQLSAVLVAMLLVPAYTYAHHLVMAIPAIVLVGIALQRNALARGWAMPLGVSAAILLYPLPHLRSLATNLLDPGSAAYRLVQEAPFAALLSLLVATAWIGDAPLDAVPRAPAPRPVDG